jgi:hypothetical protein
LPGVFVSGGTGQRQVEIRMLQFADEVANLIELWWLFALGDTD